MVRPPKRSRHVEFPLVTLAAETAQSGDGQPPLSGCEKSAQTAASAKENSPNAPLPHLVLSNNHHYVPVRGLCDV